MDLLGAHEWFSQLEVTDHDEWQMKSNSNNFNTNSSAAYYCSSNESIQAASHQAQKKSPLLTSPHHHQKKKMDFISVGGNNNNNNYSNSSAAAKSYGKACNNIVKTEDTMMSLNGDLNFSSSIHQYYETILEEEAGVNNKRVCNRTALQAQDHVLAERKRREKLTERIVALSTMVPGLKKLDKASVLGGAIKYLEQLQERIKMLEAEKRELLEEQSANNNNNNLNNNNMSSLISKRPRISVSSDEISSSAGEISYCSTPGGQPPLSSPEIEVRISEKTDVLVRVYCKKRNGVIKDILSEIEKLHLSIMSSSVIPFGTSILNITVIAQMDGDSVCLSAQNIASNLRTAIQKLMQ
uniref:BHLH type transcription factor n=1 Tax=Catharanthus roseus TaxID=4058 RepID=A0A8A6M0M9_CATRO|nr:bHLH type transcription factor [Catharanthus roseus]